MASLVTLVKKKINNSDTKPNTGKRKSSDCY